MNARRPAAGTTTISQLESGLAALDATTPTPNQNLLAIAIAYHHEGMPDGVQLMTSDLFARVLEDARQSPRLRKNFNFHASLDENPSRFLNVMVRGTYFTPHRHIDPPKPESFVVLEGCVVLFTFDEYGSVKDHYRLGPGEPATGIDLAPGIWHTLVVLSEHAVCFEVKPGPYSPASDKDFAPWAPREGDPGCREYQQALVRNICPTD